MTKAKHYLLLRRFERDLINEISVDPDPATFLYVSYIDGYVRGLTEALDLDKSEASNIRTEAAEFKNIVREKVHQVQEANKYNEALAYCKDHLVHTADSAKVLNAAKIHAGAKLWNVYREYVKSYVSVCEHKF